MDIIFVELSASCHYLNLALLCHDLYSLDRGWFSVAPHGLDDLLKVGSIQMK